MKVCTKCKIEKDFSEFYKNGKILRSYCKECHNECRRQYYLDNTDTELERARQYKLNNKIVILDPNILKHCNMCNTDKPQTDFSLKRRSKSGINPWCKVCDNAKSSKWGKDNPEKRKAKKDRRDANKAKVEYSKDWNVIDTHIKQHESCCVCCSNDNMTTDHITPVARGGGYVATNALPMCGSCNSSKKDVLFYNWVTSLPDATVRMNIIIKAIKVRNGYWRKRGIYCIN